MIRESFKSPGYDDTNQPCPHGVKGHRVINPEEWWYVVKNGDIAVALNIFSDIFPSAVTNFSDISLPMAGCLFVHVGFPCDGPDGRDKHLCEFVAGGECYGSHSYSLAALDIYRKHGAKTYEQPEAFWDALEKFCSVQSEIFRSFHKLSLV